MNNMLTQSDKKELYIYENMFSTAINQSYVSGISLESFNKIKEIYKRETGDTKIFTISCSSCVLDLYRKMGKIYFEQKDIVEEVKSKKRK